MPETLEQLKIGLENITHVHVNTSKSSGGGSASLSSQASATALSAMVSPHPSQYPTQSQGIGENSQQQQQQQQLSQPQQVVFYQSHEYIISDPNSSSGQTEVLMDQTRSQEYIVEGASYAAVVAGDFQAQPIQPAVPQQQAYEPSTAVGLQTQQAPELRRSSMEQASATAIDSVGGNGQRLMVDSISASYTVTGSGNSIADSSINAGLLREHETWLSNQESVDRIDSSSTTNQTSLPGLQLKLSQLAVSTTDSSYSGINGSEQQSLQAQPSTVTSPSIEQQQKEPKLSNEAKPLIRKVSRFQVQTVQESPRTLEQPATAGSSSSNSSNNNNGSNPKPLLAVMPQSIDLLSNV
uniref:Putative regulation of antimicrobial peptide biosynthetic process n=1 Tax=Anopheles darlingi TaxID=43151 RepID=A0A2M4DRW5_ANODA